MSAINNHATAIIHSQNFGNVSSKSSMKANSGSNNIGCPTGTNSITLTCVGGNQIPKQTPKMTLDKHLDHSDTNKVTPRRGVNKSLTKVGGRLNPRLILERPCQHHSFLTDITDVRQMEQGLLQLLDDFHSGKLQAFGKDCSFEKMDNVREQQEKLARLHFDLGAQQESYNPLSEEGRAVAKENLAKLMENIRSFKKQGRLMLTNMALKKGNQKNIIQNLGRWPLRIRTAL